VCVWGGGGGGAGGSPTMRRAPMSDQRREERGKLGSRKILDGNLFTLQQHCLL
jgi:hypothetical protein